MKNFPRTCGANRKATNSSPRSAHRKTKWRHSSAAKSEASVKADRGHVQKASATGQSGKSQTGSVATIFRLRNKSRNDLANETRTNIAHVSHPMLAGAQLHNAAGVSCPETWADLLPQSDVANAIVEKDGTNVPPFQSANSVSAAVSSTTESDGPFPAVEIDEIDESGENTTETKDLQSSEKDMQAGHDDSRQSPSYNSLQALENIIAELVLVTEDLRLSRLSADHIVNRSTDVRERNSEVTQRNDLHPERVEVSKSVKLGHTEQQASKTPRTASARSSSTLTFDLSHQRLDLSAPCGAAQRGDDQWCSKASLGASSNFSDDLCSSDPDYEADDDLVDFDVDQYFASLPSYVLEGEDEETEAFQHLRCPRRSPAPVPSLLVGRARTDSCCSGQQRGQTEQNLCMTSPKPPGRQVSWVENGGHRAGQGEECSFQGGSGKSPLATRELTARHSSLTGVLGKRQAKGHKVRADEHGHVGTCRKEHTCAATCTRRSSPTESTPSAKRHVCSTRKNDKKATKVNYKLQDYAHRMPSVGLRQSLQYDPDVEKSKTYNQSRETSFSSASQWLTPVTRGVRNLQVHYAHTNTEHNERLIFAHLLRRAHVRNAAVEEGVYASERRLYARRHDITPHATTFYDTRDFHIQSRSKVHINNTEGKMTIKKKNKKAASYKPTALSLKELGPEDIKQLLDQCRYLRVDPRH